MCFSHASASGPLCPVSDFSDCFLHATLRASWEIACSGARRPPVAPVWERWLPPGCMCLCWHMGAHVSAAPSGSLPCNPRTASHRPSEHSTTAPGPALLQMLSSAKTGFSPESDFASAPAASQCHLASAPAASQCHICQKDCFTPDYRQLGQREMRPRVLLNLR